VEFGFVPFGLTYFSGERDGNFRYRKTDQSKDCNKENMGEGRNAFSLSYYLLL